MNQIVEIFSQHPKLVGSNGHRVIWVPIPELETNITNLVQSNPDAQEEFFVNFFLDKWRQHSDRLALKHLLAYLQRLGYRVARRVHEKWKRFPPYTLLYNQQDLCQIAWLIASDPAKFFENIRLQYPPKNYVYRKMEGKIKDEIFDNLGMGARMYSDWGLLWRKSRSSLRKALRNQGYDQQLDCYLLAWDCFKEIYAPPPTGSRPLPPPKDTQFQDMADLYNLRVQSTEVAALDKADRVTIEEWLIKCIQALRNCQTLHVISIDAPSGGDEDSEPLSGRISDDSDSDPEWEQIEIQVLTEQLMAVLADFLEGIDENTDNLLLLRYGFDLDYNSIAAIFQALDTTLRSRCNRVTQYLLRRQVSEEHLSVTLEAENISKANAALKKCLNQRYKDLLFESMFRQAQRLDRQRLEIMHLYYVRHDTRENEAKIAHTLQLPGAEVSNGLVTGRQELAAASTNWIQNRLHVPPGSGSLNPLAEKIASLVEEWLPAFLIRIFNITEKEKCFRF